jgi:hypothetical protein
MPGIAWVKRAGLVTVVLLTASGLVPGSAGAVTSAAGGVPDGVVVSENPAGWTPQVLDGRINAITQVGGRVVVGGSFSKVRQAGSSAVLTRKNLFAFDAHTGAIDPTFNPAPSGGAVNALVAAPGGAAVFVGGQFTGIAGNPRAALAKLDVPSGRLSGGFLAAVKSRVDSLAVSGSRLFFSGEISTVNGTPRWGLAAVDVNGGSLDPGVAVKFSNPRTGVLTVYRIAIRPDGSRLVALGSFLKADGQDRPQLAVVDLTGGPARLADWRTDAYAYPCSTAAVFGPTYMRGVDISADGSYFVVVTTGGKAAALCDSVARFELGGTGQNIKPTWVDPSGGDSFIGVAVTDAAVYVGGHERWLNNPYNRGTGKNAVQGTGSVPRPGISALDPVNGLPLSWNPGRDRGIGVFAFLATPDGLWVGSDTDYIGGEYHPKLALLPSTGGKVLDPPAPGRLPGVIYRTVSASTPGLAAQSVDGSGSGGTVAPPGGGLDWSTARAAFPAAGSLYTIWADGRIDARPIGTGGALGPPQPLDLGGLDTLAKARFPVKSLTGAAFDAQHGRLYYTIAGDKQLYYRYFTPESGVVGGVPFVAGGASATVDWTTARGLMVANGSLYYATGSNALSQIKAW